MKKLKFYDVKEKKKFSSSKYNLVRKKGRYFAVATRKGHKCYRIVSEQFYKDNK